MLTDAIRLMVFPALMAFAASSDLFTMTISNRITLALVGGFVAVALISGMSPSDMLAHAGAAATVLAVTFVFFARGWIGGGDAKLRSASRQRDVLTDADHRSRYTVITLAGGRLQR